MRPRRSRTVTTRQRQAKGMSIRMAPVRMLPGDKEFTKRVVKVGAIALGTYAVFAIGRGLFGGK